MAFSLKKLDLNCREATQLASEAMDHPIDRLSRVGVAVHLAICGNCRRHRSNVLALRQMMAAQASGEALQLPTPLPAAAKDRIQSALDQAEAAARDGRD